MILFACAVAQELHWFSQRPDIEVLITGVGPVEAAARVAQRLSLRAYDLVVNLGIAGAFPGVANIGDGVVVTEELFEINLENGDALALPNGARTIERIACTDTPFEPFTLTGFRSVRGITVSRATATDATAQRLQALGAQVESMEGFGVLRAAGMCRIRAVELRGISNYVGDRSKSGWDFAAGIAGLQRVTAALLTQIDSQS